MHQEVVLEKGFERDHQPMLAHEILLRIAHYIENGIDIGSHINPNLGLGFVYQGSRSSNTPFFNLCSRVRVRVKG